jgi:glycosyltransferase involved in cell wall biosynthesis
MKVVHVVPSIAAEASGPSYSVPALCEALARQGVSVALHVLAPPPSRSPSGVVLEVYAPLAWATRLGVSPTMQRGLRAAALGGADVVHNHSLWMMPNVYPAWAVRGTRSRLITSPRGVLSEWALRRSRWRKRLFWTLLQGAALRRTDCFHATAESEHDDIRRLGLRGPIAIIPNGIDVDDDVLVPKTQAHRPRRLLYLGRVHPKKGIDVLLRAWREVQGDFSEWELHIVGPGEAGHDRELQSLAAQLELQRVGFAGALYGEAKREAYREADLFVLPTHNENFGLAVAEALAHGTPAVVTKGAPWAGLQTHDCGWWIDHGVAPLVDTLRTALSRGPEQLQQQGLRGREWMRRDFSWDRVATMMYETYRWLIAGGTRPPFIRE